MASNTQQADSNKPQENSAPNKPQTGHSQEPAGSQEQGQKVSQPVSESQEQAKGWLSAKNGPTGPHGWANAAQNTSPGQLKAIRQSLAKVRLRAWRPKWLKAYRQAGNMRLACEASQVDRSTVTRAIQREPAFAAAVALAQQEAAELMEAHLIRRATVGEPEPVWMQSRNHGQPIKVDTIYRKSDKCLLFWLEHNSPKYAPKIQQDITSGGKPLPAVSPITQVSVVIPSNGRGDSQAEIEAQITDQQGQPLALPDSGDV